MTDLDALFESLAETRRRHALYVLRRRGRPVSVEELAAAVRRLGPESSGGRGERPSTGALREALVVEHLPALARADLVRFDHGTRIVELAPVDPGVSIVLDLAWAFETGRR